MAQRPLNAFHRILAIRLDNIGDVVMTGPALRALKQIYPQARLTLMASPAGSQAAPLLPWVDDVITWRASWQDISKDAAVDIEKETELVRLLKSGSFDAAFIFTSFSQSPYPPAYACALAGIPVRVGQSKEFGGSLLSQWVKPLPDQSHQVDRNLHLLREAGIHVMDDRLELRVGDEDQQNADLALIRAGISPGAAFLALAPGASAVSRRYPEERFATAAQLLAVEGGLPLVLLGSPREVGKFPVLEQLAAEQPDIHNFIGQTSLAEMAGIIRRASVVLCNNSGSMHIAAALQRPSVILFAGTELQEQWVPRTREDFAARVLNRPTPCTPCHRFDCPYQLACLDIPAEETAAAALALINNEMLQGNTGPNTLQTPLSPGRNI
jgi:lipopolysaccharide heptosyltransferase II